MTSMGNIAVVDCQMSGISGDMLLSSLVDAGANKKKVVSAIFECQNFLKGSTISEVNFKKKIVGDFRATQLVLKYRDGVPVRKGIEIYASLSQCCERIGLAARAKVFALDTMKKIILAEATIHGQLFSSVHLHEASSIDTFADLIGCAVALDDLKLFHSKVYSTRVAVGSGQFNFSHGSVPNPGNAIIEIFKGLPFTLFGNNLEEELTTPTGAALLVTLCSNGLDYYPAISPEKAGYGAGRKSLNNVPNILRLLIGRSPLSLDANTDTVFVIETKIDDISGEIMGSLIEQMDKLGALDISVLQGLSKKNRPAYNVKVISDIRHLDIILEALFAESGTLGARIQEVKRIVLTRNLITTSMLINGKSFNIRVKIARDLRGDIINIKPEFEDIKIISRAMGLPTKRIMDLVKAETIQRFGET
ncbi:MAG TPA: nickel pincer cofactor biosynthesis protein LarC [Nitrososphaeraceae archaeon]|nr:nickel pincer cofactor biosynthesis protein LarC [Nitrososphaeraceae archaeon]